MNCSRCFLVAAATAIFVSGVASAAPRPDALRKLDARLVARAVAAPQDVVPVWVTFADKGEHGPADLAARLAAAERALTPRNRARRLRNGVTPLVDAMDLPIEPRYLAGLRAEGLAPYAVSRWFNRAAVRVAAGELPRIAALASVRSIAPVPLASVVRDPSEPGLRDVAPRPLSSGAAPARTAAYSYGNSFDEVQQVNTIAVHDSGYIGAGVLVCMLDDGFYGQDVHEATSTIDVPPGMRRDFVDGDTLVTDASAGAHGETTLSCIGANKPGWLLGTAFGASFALARTEIDATETPVEMTNWGLGVEWADSLGADLISSSLGYTTFDSPWPSYSYADLDGHTTDVTRYAEIAAAKGILVCNSAGNEGNKPWHFVIAPADANGDSVLAVGGVTASNTLSGFSSRGPTYDGRIKPDLCARGTSASVVAPGTVSGYGTSSGTSFACPLAAGVAACLLGARPTWRAVDVIRAMKLAATQASSPDTLFGWGIVDGLKALQSTPPGLLGTPAATTRPFGIALLGPNPLRGGGAARVRFALGSGGDAASAAVTVVDVTGRTVRTLWNGTLARGAALETAWDGRDAGGHRVLPGVYWVALRSGQRSASVRLVTL